MKILLEAKEVKEIIEKHILQTTGFNAIVETDLEDIVASLNESPAKSISDNQKESVEEPEEDIELETLKKEAKELGISIRGNISKETLEERIREYEAKIPVDIDEGLGEDSVPEWEETDERIWENFYEKVTANKEEADLQEEDQPRKKSIFAKR